MNLPHEKLAKLLHKLSRNLIKNLVKEFMEISLEALNENAKSSGELLI
jgi:hypothetical protein